MFSNKKSESQTYKNQGPINNLISLWLFDLTRFNQTFVVRIWFFSSCKKKGIWRKFLCHCTEGGIPHQWFAVRLDQMWAPLLLIHLPRVSPTSDRTTSSHSAAFSPQFHNQPGLKRRKIKWNFTTWTSDW